MVQILGLGSLKDKLRKRLERAKHDPGDDAVAGFGGVAYGIYVHEDLNAHHEVGQAKFLEEPARTMTNEGVFATNARQNLERGMTLAEALLINALLLQREAQLLTPVDTGQLRASAFSDYVRNLSSALATAKSKGEAARADWLGRAEKRARKEKISIVQALRVMREERIASIKRSNAKRGSRAK